ncbi:MAG: HEAT repeat domain-containing protein, partial [Flavobacteriales bacterium]
PLYIIPIDVDIYTAAGKQTHKIEIREADSTYSFNVAQEPLCVNADAKKVTLCEKDDIRSASQWAYLFYNGENFTDRFEAIKECSPLNSEEAHKVLMDALNDKFWYIRELAVKNLKKLCKSKGDQVKAKLIDMIANDPKPSVRSSAVRNIQKYFKDDASLLPVFQKAAEDSSYDVMSEAFLALAKTDPKTGLELARKHEKEKSGTVREAIAQIYAESGTASDHTFFKDAISKGSGLEKYSLMIHYGTYLKRMGYDETDKGLALIKEVATGESGWFVRLSAYQTLSILETHYDKKALEAQTLAESLRMDGKTMEATEAERDMMKSKGMVEKIAKMVEELKANETDKNVLKYIH